MNFYLPTREECQEIVSRTEAFYCTKREVQGFEIELYDYRLASYRDFFPENEDKNYAELRGLCFVNNNGTWERNILMQKFFNLNETATEKKMFVITLEDGKKIELNGNEKIKLTDGTFKLVKDLQITDEIDV